MPSLVWDGCDLCAFHLVLEDGSLGAFDMAFHVLYGAEGAAGDSKAKLAVVGKVSMSIGMAELLFREEMKTKSNSHHLQRWLPVQLNVNGLFIEATLSSIRPTQMRLSLNIDMSSMAFIEPLPVIDFVAQILGKDVHSKPLSNVDRIKTIQQNDYEYNPYAKEFGISIDSKLASVEARVLPAPWVNKSLYFYRCVICFADYCASYLNIATVFIFLALIYA